MLGHILIPLYSFCVLVLVQFALVFRKPQTGIVKTLFRGFLVGLLVLGGAEIFQGLSPLAIVDFFIYFSLFFCYFNFVHIPDASVRIRILRELAKNSKGLSRNEIYAIYNANTILSARLQRKKKSEQIQIIEGRYVNRRRKMLYVAYIFRLFKILVLSRRALWRPTTLAQ